VIGARVLVGAVDAMTFISVLRLIPAWFATRALPAASVQLIFGMLVFTIFVWTVVLLCRAPRPCR
jgi:hypothetical protein